SARALPEAVGAQARGELIAVELHAREAAGAVAGFRGWRPGAGSGAGAGVGGGAGFGAPTPLSPTKCSKTRPADTEATPRSEPVSTPAADVAPSPRQRTPPATSPAS